jgi:hypothetical protein
MKKHRRTVAKIAGAAVLLVAALGAAATLALREDPRERAAQSAFSARIGEIAAAARTDFLTMKGFEGDRAELYVTDEWHALLAREKEQLIEYTAGVWAAARQSAGFPAAVARGSVSFHDTWGNRVGSWAASSRASVPPF